MSDFAKLNVGNTAVIRSKLLKALCNRNERPWFRPGQTQLNRRYLISALVAAWPEYLLAVVRFFMLICDHVMGINYIQRKHGLVVLV